MISVKIGVVGCGRIATIVHLPSLKKINRIDITSAVDVHESRLNETLEKFRIAEGYTDYQQMLKKADIDAVLVCTPPEKHFSIVLDSIKNEKHVICEKPLATTVVEGLAIKKAFESQQKKMSNLSLIHI